MGPFTQILCVKRWLQIAFCNLLVAECNQLADRQGLFSSLDISYCIQQVSLTPGFSPVEMLWGGVELFQQLLGARDKLLKQFWGQSTSATGLKPGVNETGSRG